MTVMIVVVDYVFTSTFRNEHKHSEMNLISHSNDVEYKDIGAVYECMSSDGKRIN